MPVFQTFVMMCVGVAFATGQQTDFFTGRYELTATATNPMDLLQYMNAIGVDTTGQHKMKGFRRVEIKKKGDFYTMKINGKERKVHPGKEVDDIYIDGRKYKLTILIHGPATMRVLKFDGGFSAVCQSIFDTAGFNTTCVSNGHVMRRSYKRVHDDTD